MISIIVAIGEGNRVIGDKGKLPWNIPEDLKRFRTLTTGHPIIMGKNTFLSIGKALPNRTNIVLSDAPWNDAPDGVVVARSLEDALEGDIAATKAFSRRQMTWFRKFTPVLWYDLSAESEERILRQTVDFSRQLLEDGATCTS